MKKVLSYYIAVIFLLLIHPLVFAAGGQFFSITNNEPLVQPYKIELCLNAVAHMTCQEYTVRSRTLSIRTVIPNKLYPSAGIKIKSGSFVPNGNCTAIGNGYCNLQINNLADQIFTAGSPGDKADLHQDATELAHAVNDNATNAALTGNSRTVTIRNTGRVNATGLTLVLPTFRQGFLPPTFEGTCEEFVNNKDPLPPGESCTIIVKPDVNGTSSFGVNDQPCSLGEPAIPWVVGLNSDNSGAATFHFSVLTYGCVYQGGYIFAIDDTAPGDAKIGGTVAAFSDQAQGRRLGPGIIWSSNGKGKQKKNTAFNAIPGINEDDTTGAGDACDGATDGLCNSTQIWDFYPAVDLNFYAAGLCHQTIEGLTDWYLPAICQLGYDAGQNGAGCGAPTIPPSLQTMQTNLYNRGVGGLDRGALEFTSSTQASNNPARQVWQQTFNNTNQRLSNKKQTDSVRCVRNLTTD
jgi:hypothetical protein